MSKKMKVLLLVDIQNDFCPGGALAVPDGDEVVAIANELMRSGKFDVVMATRDFHPSDHLSFAVNQGKSPFEEGDVGGITQTLWPAHCVQGTAGSEFHPDLELDRVDVFVPKGTDREIDSYSGFFDNGHKRETTLRSALLSHATFNRVDKLQDIELYVCGLATDYCVAATVRDALELHIPTTLVVDGCRAINMAPNDEVNTLRELASRGATLTSSRELLTSERAQPVHRTERVHDGMHP
ncbi:MAG: bifunctional nicotinamidase/pyrazinamidase [Bdellovibrionales bacterium]|nr:bifunctional nicotinamidase/pyrazinamidase [Bdellovibrionales bacterium]